MFLKVNEFDTVLRNLEDRCHYVEFLLQVFTYFRKVFIKFISNIFITRYIDFPLTLEISS